VESPEAFRRRGNRAKAIAATSEQLLAAQTRNHPHTASTETIATTPKMRRGKRGKNGRQKREESNRSRPEESRDRSRDVYLVIIMKAMTNEKITRVSRNTSPRIIGTNIFPEAEGFLLIDSRPMLTTRP
jgi:hypothetical protein